MKTPTLPRRIQIVVSLITIALLSGCASVTEEERFAREYERAERHEEIRSFIASCEAGGYSIFYTGPSYQKLRDPVKHIPGGARMSDYQCVNQTAVNGFLQRGS